MNRNKLNLKITIATAVAFATIMAPLSAVIAEATTLKAIGNVNVREAGYNTATKVGYAPKGTVAEYLGVEDGWFKIDMDGVVGYSYRKYWIGNTVTTLRNVNIRNLPNNGGDKVGYAVAGSEAILLGRNGSWIYIELNGVRGFSYKSYWDLSDTLIDTLPYVAGIDEEEAVMPEEQPAPSTSTPEEDAAAETYQLYVDVPGYMTAADAAAGTNPVKTQTAGSYYVYKEYNNILNVTSVKGSAGAWIDPDTNVEKASTGTSEQKQSEDEVAEKVIEAARSLLGAPYVYGGESWSEGGFDCSGLTQYCYRQAGITIPRTATQQWNGIPEKVDNPKPGDIIVFAQDGDVYHVGIYIGDNKMIHSPMPDKYVEIKDLTWHYNNDRVYGFLRPRN